MLDMTHWVDLAMKPQHRQIKYQIRCHRMQHLVLVYAVCHSSSLGQVSLGEKVSKYLGSDKHCYLFEIVFHHAAQIYPAFANSVDPDQLASEEAN